MRERTHIGHVIHNTRRWSAANAACTHYDKEAKQQGYDKLIVKPIPIEELGSIIKVYLGVK